MYLKSLPLCSLFLASLISSASALAADNSQVVVKENNNASATSVDDYWTPERMQNAKPMPLPQVDRRSVKIMPTPDATQQKLNDGDSGDGAPPEGYTPPEHRQLFKPLTQSFNSSHTKVMPNDRGTSNEQFSSSRLVPLTADLSYPYSTVGKLFFTIPNKGNYVCSASVLRPRVILTAGHCVHSGSGGSAGFYGNFKFVPAFRDGAAPYQTWNWAYAITTSTWATGGGTVPNAADYAMIEAGDNRVGDVTRTIGSVTGYLGWQTQALIPNHAHLLGYPCNLDSCQKMHQVTAQSAKNISPNNVEYGSDMGGGSSGGPWVQNFGSYSTGQTGGLNAGLNRIVGVTSYGYISTDPKAQGSAIPDSRFVNILNTICAHRAGNC
jgi:V8-like Glu-specific endopeptidase